ncbi:MIP/aquaporin family protein [Microbacterium karelineae]|uniref:MIP/aquaporin family protein n=1 Tax=Microbacterium karelineae TaxID=2654283 RepID=UPI0012EAC034|nr:MIP/aquaporin family protein [Microbacterium karelineae]
MSLPRELTAEFVGSALLALVVIGSGIMAQRLSEDVGLQLLENAIATAFGLGVLIAMFAPISGAHFNPVVTLADTITGGKTWRQALAYMPTQVVGCIAGALLANLVFGEAAVSWSTNERAVPSNLLSEVVATAGLVAVIFLLVRTGRGSLAAPAVGAYIGGAYWFTASTSFANPAITVGRMFSDSFAGIAPTSALPFIGAQLVGGALGLALAVWLTPRRVS